MLTRPIFFVVSSPQITIHNTGPPKIKVPVRYITEPTAPFRQMFRDYEAYYFRAASCFTPCHISTSTVIIVTMVPPPCRAKLLVTECQPLKFSLQYASVPRRCYRNKSSKDGIHGMCHYNLCATHDTKSMTYIHFHTGIRPYCWSDPGVKASWGQCNRSETASFQLKYFLRLFQTYHAVENNHSVTLIQAIAQFYPGISNIRRIHDGEE